MSRRARLARNSRGFAFAAGVSSAFAGQGSRIRRLTEGRAEDQKFVDARGSGVDAAGLQTCATISLGAKRTILPPRLLMVRAGATSARRPIDPGKETFLHSPQNWFPLSAITLIFNSTAVAPSMSNGSRGAFRTASGGEFLCFECGWHPRMSASRRSPPRRLVITGHGRSDGHGSNCSARSPLQQCYRRRETRHPKSVHAIFKGDFHDRHVVFELIPAPSRSQVPTDARWARGRRRSLSGC